MRNQISKTDQLQAIDWQTFTPAPVVGVDEVGRGCLAGAVYAAAVCFKNQPVIKGLTDSKLMSEKQRLKLAPLILNSHYFGLGIATPEEIDELNILQASLLAMARALEALESKMGVQAGHVLVDGNQKIPGLKSRQTTVVQGDLRCLPISAASIIAKVARDKYMQELALEYPQYGFERHKGYGVQAHRLAIAKFGASSIHRRSFKGVREYLQGGTSG